MRASSNGGRTSASPSRSADARISKAVLVVPALATLVLSVLFWHGLQGTDDLRYARMVMALLPGGDAPSLPVQPQHHDARIGLIYPLAGVFAAFGVSELSLALLPLVASALTASLVAWLACWFRGNAAGLTAGLLYAFFPLTISLATFFVPEPILGFEICLAVALFLWAVEGRSGHPAAVLFVAGAIVGIAYLTTEVGALMLPVLYLYRIVAHRSVRLRDAALLAGFLVVWCGELAYHLAVHGNPLYRLTLTTRYLSDPMLVAANVDLSYRLLKTIPAMFAYPSLEFGIFGPLLVLAGVYGLMKWRETALLVIWAAAIMLFYNFMSVSFRQYIVLPVTGRLLAPACLPLLVLSGVMLVDAYERIARNRTRILARIGGVAFAGGVVALTAMSLLVMYLDASTPTLTRAAAWNAREAAAHLQRYPSIVLVADRRSASAMHFFRPFNAGDAFVGFAQAARAERALPGDPEKPAFVVLNGPFIHEREITGERYGRGFLSSADLAAIAEFRPAKGAEVFSARMRADPLLEALLGYAPVRHLLGQRRLRLAEHLFTKRASLGDVTVFPWSPT